MHPLDANQTILIKNPHEGCASLEHQIPEDHMFIGKGSLVHAGSLVEGYRLHGVFVLDASVEESSKDEHTCLDLNDKNYPL